MQKIEVQAGQTVTLVAPFGVTYSFVSNSIGAVLTQTGDVTGVVTSGAGAYGSVIVKATANHDPSLYGMVEVVYLFPLTITVS